MDYCRAEPLGGDLCLSGMRHFHPGHTLDSGQCFRWRESGPSHWEGVACGRRLRLSARGNALILHDVSPQEFEAVWRNYFDLDRDYGALFAAFSDDPVLARAMEFAPGIRVLRQPPFETLCSFILSQNNHITRIKGLVDRLCALLGRPLGEDVFDFPEPQALASLTPDDLAPVRAGFRARYLIDAAQKVADGSVPLEALYTLPLEEAQASLRQIAGVGPKVADCVLLYGLGRVECIPVDVWMARALEHFYPDGFPEALSPWGGIAQQTLFHYVRCCKDALPALS